MWLDDSIVGLRKVIEWRDMQFLIAFGAYAPLVFVYLAVAVICWKQGLSEEPSKGMHPTAVAMGQTCCFMWILVAPFLLAMLALLFGPTGACFFNLGGGCLFVAIWLFEEKKLLFLPGVLFVLGSIGVCASLLAGLRH